MSLRTRLIAIAINGCNAGFLVGIGIARPMQVWALVGVPFVVVALIYQIKTELLPAGKRHE
jgi:hypothetical protein